eukprot:gnl/TRDRNA2_/TRDRNA2_86439_c0_seq1.p1 gnl/TRDRNA2_/TRDRNA2_86439_c0~~gnl/TRDRNA2_/TRDRNA2_86439_c0_seq1.p1  ORF type:complete len:378 (+),score=48.40 gnl/TRDRNA2_/TRDRNA2_86439_c0_seq1:2-1135(+)
MDRKRCYFNAGAMVLAPSWPLFELLVSDVQEPDPMWHRGAWSPEQSYLSCVLAGEWSHISQLYNLEVQLHSGVPLSRLWEDAGAADVAVAHFSGTKKPWDSSPEIDPPVLASDWVKDIFAGLSAEARASAAVRCRALHAHWHHMLAAALRFCRNRGAAARVNEFWTSVLHTGDLRSCDAPGAPALREDPAFLVGDEVAVSRAEEATKHWAQVLRVTADGSMVVWRTPLPAEDPFCAGHLGSCYTLRKGSSDSAVPMSSCFPEAASNEAVCMGEPKLGAPVIAWFGEGHMRGLVVAVRAGDCLVRFATCRTPHWLALEEMRYEDVAGKNRLQCATCLSWQPGSFESDGFWCCTDCRHRKSGQKAAASATSTEDFVPES